MMIKKALDKFNLNFNKKENFKESVFKMPPQVFFPSSFDEVSQMMEVLKNKRAIIINVSSLEIKDRYRIIDFFSGYIYALEGYREKLELNIYLFVVKN